MFPVIAFPFEAAGSVPASGVLLVVLVVLTGRDPWSVVLAHRVGDVERGEQGEDEGLEELHQELEEGHHDAEGEAEDARELDEDAAAVDEEVLAAEDEDEQHEV